MTAKVGGQPVRDIELLAWCATSWTPSCSSPCSGRPPDDPRGSTVPVPVTVTRPRRPRLRAALALGLASLALAACGTDLAGAASVVGPDGARRRGRGRGRRGARAVRGGRRASRTSRPSARPRSTSRNVERMTRHLVLEAAAAEKGIVVTPGQVDEVIASSVDGQFEGSRERFDARVRDAGVRAGVRRSVRVRPRLPHPPGAAGPRAPGRHRGGAGRGASATSASCRRSSTSACAARYGTWDPAPIGLGPVPDDLSFVPGAKPAASPSPRPVRAADAARMPGRLVLLATSPRVAPGLLSARPGSPSARPTSCCSATTRTRCCRRWSQPA